MFYTVPWTAYPQDPNRIIWAEDAQLLWDAIAADRPILEITDDDTVRGDGTSADDGASGDTDAPGEGTEPRDDETYEPSSPQLPSGDAWNPLTWPAEEAASGE